MTGDVLEGLGYSLHVSFFMLLSKVILPVRDFSKLTLNTSSSGVLICTL